MEEGAKAQKMCKGAGARGLTHLPVKSRAAVDVRAGITEGRVRSGAGTGRASEAPCANTLCSFCQVMKGGRHLPTPGRKISFSSKDNCLSSLGDCMLLAWSSVLLSESPSFQHLVASWLTTGSPSVHSKLCPCAHFPRSAYLNIKRCQGAPHILTRATNMKSKGNPQRKFRE